MSSYFENDKHFKMSSLCYPPFGEVCVAVAISPENKVAVRNSGDPDKTTLVFNRDEWDVFIKGVKNGEFDLT